MTAVTVILFLLLAAMPGQAEVPLPRPRPAPDVVVDTFSPPLPRPRPDTPAAGPALPGPVSAQAAADPPSELLPHRTACPVILAGHAVGRPAPPIGEGQCVVPDPWTVTRLALAGSGVIDLSGVAVVTCAMADALADWAAALDRYFRAVWQQPLARIEAGTSYLCRPRNNQPGAQLSEHGHANALDVVAFVLADGQRIAPLVDWDETGPAGKAVRFAHQAACSRFTTVLGPDANALHHDHLHVDMGCHGRDCTYRLCQ